MLSAEETTAVQTFLTKPKKPQDAKMVMGGMGMGGGTENRRAAGSSSSKKGPLGETVGDRLEVSGESLLLVKEVAERIAQDRYSTAVDVRCLLCSMLLCPMTDPSLFFVAAPKRISSCNSRGLGVVLLPVDFVWCVFFVRWCMDEWASERECHGRVCGIYRR